MLTSQHSQARGILTLAACLALTLIMPLQQLLFPDLTPDANYATFFFALIVVGIFLLQFAAMYTAGQDRIKAQEETILQQQARMALLEELQQEIRTFRHDFTNLFSGLTLQAQEGDLAGIQDFMRRTSSYFDEKLGSEIAQMDGLNNIQLYPLRSLLATKLAKMRQMRIKGVPLRYNYDKQKKPLFSRSLSVCRLLFNTFSKLKIDENYKEKRRLFY